MQGKRVGLKLTSVLILSDLGPNEESTQRVRDENKNTLFNRTGQVRACMHNHMHMHVCISSTKLLKS